MAILAWGTGSGVLFFKDERDRKQCRDLGVASETHAQNARGRVSGSKTVIRVTRARIHVRLFEGQLKQRFGFIHELAAALLNLFEFQRNTGF